MKDLVFNQATVTFGHGAAAVTAVDSVDLIVPEGTVVGLVGESGSGKSTLARAAVGLQRLSSGSVTFAGSDIQRRRRARRQPIQMVFQDPFSSLDPRMTVGASIAEAMTATKGRAARRAAVGSLLQLVQLDPADARLLPGVMSGGQCQRVALARALASSPDVIIADEMTSALDVSVQAAVLNLVRDIQRSIGLSMLFISHNLAVVRHVSDVIAVMSRGRVVETGPTEKLLANPQHEYTRVLVDSTPRRSERLGRGAGSGRET